MDKRIPFILAVCLLLVAGCGQQGQPEQQKKQLQDPFIGGTQGLETYFLEGMPPEKIYDNNQSPFSVAVALSNKGEADIGNGTDNEFVQVELLGLNPSEWGTNESLVRNISRYVRGARKNIDGSKLEGEITQTTFSNLRYDGNLRGNTPFTIRANVCYDYKTIATSKVCIKKNPLQHIQDTSVCNINGKKKVYNSGAPVHVTNLQQVPIGSDEIQVSFDIEHVGPGQFYGRKAGETCDTSPTNTNKNRLEVLVKPLSDNSLGIECPRLGNTNSGSISGRNVSIEEGGNVTLAQGAPVKVSCTIEDVNSVQSNIFQDILEIELRYRYGQFIETPILVQDASNEP